MARIREEAARQAPRRGTAPRIAPFVAAAAPQRIEAAAPAIAGGFSDALPVDFPTSILGTAVVATPPLLAAFASREGLLGAIVFSEALSPPIALRENF